MHRRLLRQGVPVSLRRFLIAMQILQQQRQIERQGCTGMPSGAIGFFRRRQFTVEMLPPPQVDRRMQVAAIGGERCPIALPRGGTVGLSLIHISEPTRQAEISYAVFCLKKKKLK